MNQTEKDKAVQEAFDIAINAIMSPLVGWAEKGVFLYGLLQKTLRKTHANFDCPCPNCVGNAFPKYADEYLEAFKSLVDKGIMVPVEIEEEGHGLS